MNLHRKIVVLGHVYHDARVGSRLTTELARTDGISARAARTRLTLDVWNDFKRPERRECGVRIASTERNDSRVKLCLELCKQWARFGNKHAVEFK